MSQILDQIKVSIGSHLSKHYKVFKTQMSPEDWNEFESWFWKIKPYLEVDLTKYNTNTSETFGPNINNRKPVDEPTQSITDEANNCKNE